MDPEPQAGKRMCHRETLSMSDSMLPLFPLLLRPVADRRLCNPAHRLATAGTCKTTLSPKPTSPKERRKYVQR